MSTEPLPPNYYDHREDGPPPGRRRRNWLRIIVLVLNGLTIVSTLILIGLLVLLHKPAFRQYVLRIAHQRILDATGFNLRLRDFSVHLSGLNPTVDMYDVVVDAAPPYNSAPLLQVDHLSVGVTVVSLLHRNWYLNDVTMNHPVARIVIDKNGANNLPLPKNLDSASKTNIFDLGVRHVHIDAGEIYYNDVQDALRADLKNLQLQTGFDPTSRSYSGNLTYENGVLQIGDYSPLTHSLDAEFEATSTSLHLKRGTLSSGNSKVELTAMLENYSSPKVQSSYHIAVDGSELRTLLKNDSLPIGVLRLAGTAQYEQTQNTTVLQALTLEGNLTSESLLIQTPTLPTQVRDVSGRYGLQHGNLDIRNLSAGLLGGTFKGSVTIHDVGGAAESQLQAVVNNVGLRAVQALANPQSLQQVSINGTATARIQASWRKALNNLSAKTDANVNGTLAPPRNAAHDNVPLTGAVHVQYSSAARQVTFTQSVLRMPQTTLTLNGTVSNRSALRVEFASNDLHEVETAAAVFSPAVSQQQLGLSGTASFNGTVRGTTDNPQINGTLTAASLHVKGTDWQSVKGNVDLTPSQIKISNGDIVPANREHVAFNLTADLNHWAFEKTNPVQLDLKASQLDVAKLQSLTGIQAHITGTLGANVSLHGSIQNPIGQGTITVTQATVADEPIQTLNVSFQGNGNELHANLRARTPAGTAQSDLTYFPKEEKYDATLTAKGIRLDQFNTLRARNLQLHGVLDLEAKGSGTLTNPAVQLQAQIPELQIQNQTIKDLTLRGDIANRIATVNLDSRAMNTFVKGHGKVNLTGDYVVDAAFDTSTISLQPFIAAYSPTQAANVAGQTEIHGTVKGPLKDISRLDVHITIPTFTASYKNTVQLAAVDPIKINYSNGTLTIDRTALRGTDTDLQLQGSIPLSTNAPASLLLIGTIDLQVAQLLNPDITSSGQIRFNINSYGPQTNPNVQGQIQLVNATFAMADAPAALEKGNGVLNLTSNRLEIQHLTGEIGGGELTATGAINYRPTLQYNVALSGRGVRFHIPDGVREGVDADLTLIGNKDSGVVRGQVRLNEVSFAQDFDLSSVAGVAANSTLTVPSPALQRLRLDVGVQSTDDLNLVSSKLSIQGAANLRVQGTAADPVLLGRINLSGGDVIFRGARYEVQPSTIAFVNPYRLEPRLNVDVDSTVKEYKVHMQFRGTLDHLRTTYTSEPPLPQADVINLLVFGKTTEQQATDSTPGNLAAESAIASAVSSQVTGRIEKVAGISQLSVDPVLKDSQQNPGARVTIQQRVTGTVFVTFATDVSGIQRQIVKVEYQASPRLSILGVRDENGGFALDFRIRNTW